MARGLQDRIDGRNGAHCSFGFTIIELLVAMTILMVIVMIVGLFFQSANSTWNSGTKRAEVNMEGRALVDYMAQELSQSVTNGFDVSDGGSTAKFTILGEATPPATPCRHEIEYSLSGKIVSRTMVDGVAGEMGDDIDELKFFVAPTTDGLPLFVDVRVTLTNGVYESRAHFVNRDRYRM